MNVVEIKGNYKLIWIVVFSVEDFKKFIVDYKTKVSHMAYTKEYSQNLGYEIELDKLELADNSTDEKIDISNNRKTIRNNFVPENNIKMILEHYYKNKVLGEIDAGLISSLELMMKDNNTILEFYDFGRPLEIYNIEENIPPDNANFYYLYDGKIYDEISEMSFL